MKVTIYAEGSMVYELTKFYDGTTKRTLIRECRDEAEAKAVANYYNIRRA